ncbi:DUF6498-containing protein [Mycolicibacterium sediminis]|uniref:Uncharacterized protein n=1 Tax=Mycolicibacterium sediminis TaxID=1286180 RepID=A0A7I7QVD8_9MYCO|nr:DUF6498-containing protein [Mycolicibacterium sediminis]BBY30261.1 hypothetical protein MSEDJ_43570 [Mycolicibacterium sediminis]
MTRIGGLLTLLAINAVPAFGWFAGNWSDGTTLAVYWFENVAVCLSVWARIVVHRRRSPRRGHFRYEAAGESKRSSTGSFVQGYLITTLAFCTAHGVFLGMILLLLTVNGRGEFAVVDWRTVGIGCACVVVVLLVDFAVDLKRLPNWSFLSIEQMAYRGLGRVVVVHLTLIFGLVAVAITDAPNSLFGVFIVLKTLYAVASALPQWEPASAPPWLSRVMNRMPNVHPGEKFEEFWARDRVGELERRARNEEPWTPPGTRRVH